MSERSRAETVAGYLYGLLAAVHFDRQEDRTRLAEVLEMTRDLLPGVEQIADETNAGLTGKDGLREWQEMNRRAEMLVRYDVGDAEDALGRKLTPDEIEHLRTVLTETPKFDIAVRSSMNTEESQ